MTPAALRFGSAEFGEPVYGGAIVFGLCAAMLFHTIYVNDHFEVGRVVHLLFYFCVAGAAVCVFAPQLGIGP